MAVELELVAPLARAPLRALEAEVERYGRFLGQAVGMRAAQRGRRMPPPTGGV